MTIENNEQLRDLVTRMTLPGATVTYPSPVGLLVQALTNALGKIDRLEKERDTYAELAANKCVIQKVNDVLGQQTLCSSAEYNKMKAELDRIKNVDVGELAEVFYNSEQYNSTYGYPDGCYNEDKNSNDEHTKLRVHIANKIAQAVKDFIVGGKDVN